MPSTARAGDGLDVITAFGDGSRLRGFGRPGDALGAGAGAPPGSLYVQSLRPGDVAALTFGDGARQLAYPGVPRSGGVCSLTFGDSAKVPAINPKARSGDGLSLTFYDGTRGGRAQGVPRSGDGLSLTFYDGTKPSSGGGPGPQVTNQTPAPGSNLGTADTVSFDVVDAIPFLFLEVQVDQNQREVVHDGTAFCIPYLGSIRLPVTNGWRYQVRRTGGWVQPPTFRVRVYDVAEQGG